MARIRLLSVPVGRGLGVPYYRPEDRSGTIYHIPLPRLTLRLFVLPRDAVDRAKPDKLPDDWMPDTVLDTGAPLTIFPFQVWQPFADAIQWLNQPPAGSGGRSVTILGGTFPYRLGRLRFGAVDLDGNWLPAVSSNAWFLEDTPTAPRQAVLGLRTRLFEKRQLRCAEVPEDVFGQVWWLEDS
ncbi:MAG: hypothetical protein L0241_00220 [Planctomycetia bacterium]|nr:hypothetical protein [Planctomycetia bacterium]